jgi:hypothetical protein
VIRRVEATYTLVEALYHLTRRDSHDAPQPNGSAVADFETSYTKAYDADAFGCAVLAIGQLRNDVVIRNLAVIARGTAS